jgi:hypothetical protein
MKLFERSDTDGWGNRLNLIDENNVFVGYDFESSCCEDFGYRFETSKRIIIEEKPDLNGAFFTLNHKKLKATDDYYEDDGVEYGFEIRLSNGELIWFVIYNYHNGYYAHGFSFKNDKETLTEGWL